MFQGYRVSQTNDDLHKDFQALICLTVGKDFQSVDSMALFVSP